LHLLVCYLNKIQNARCNDKYNVMSFNFMYFRNEYMKKFESLVTARLFCGVKLANFILKIITLVMDL